jgi:hypothetical protein
MTKVSLLAWLILLPSMALAEITEEGGGILFGDDHAFSFQAPPGWVLDSESGAKQGLHAVFYRVGQTWEQATTIAYARAATKDEVIRDIPSLVRFNVDRFHQSGSPNYEAKFVKTIPIPEGNRKAHIYYFEGDSWGNYEAAGYVEETKTINFVILSSKTKESFKAALPSFEALITSYLYLADRVQFEGK